MLKHLRSVGKWFLGMHQRNRDMALERQRYRDLPDILPALSFQRPKRNPWHRASDEELAKARSIDRKENECARHLP